MIQKKQKNETRGTKDEDFQVLDICSALIRRVEHLERDNVAQKLEIVKLKARVKKLEQSTKVKSSKFKRLRKVGTSRRIESSDDLEDVFNQWRMFDDMDMNEGIELVKDAEVAESEGRHDVAKQAEIYNIDLDHSLKVLSMQEDDSEVQEVVEVVTTAKLITKVAAASQVSAVSTTILAELLLNIPVETPKVKDKGKGIMVEAPKPMKKKDQIKLDVEYARKLHEELNKDDADFNKDIDWNAAMDYVNKKSSINPQYIKRYHGMKKRPQTESEARKNMMIYLKNTVGYKMDFFKGMSYADICPIFQARFYENIRFLFKSREEMEAEDEEIIKSINETPTQKAAKRRKLNKEAQEAEALKKQLEIDMMRMMMCSLKQLQLEERCVGNKMHKAFPLPRESSHWQYKIQLPVKVVPTARRLEMPLPGVCTAIEEMLKKLPVKDRWQLH
nr:hypothetical protein [Tanacetum cinerariifolium]